MFGIAAVAILFAAQGAQGSTPVQAGGLPTLTDAVCEDPAQRKAAIERRSTAMDPRQQELRLSQAQQSARDAETHLVARIKRFATRAKWTEKQEGDFAWGLFQHPQVLRIRSEPSGITKAMVELMTASQAEPDESEQCHLLVDMLELQSELETNDERQTAMMEKLFEAEAKRLGISPD